MLSCIGGRANAPTVFGFHVIRANLAGLAVCLCVAYSTGAVRAQQLEAESPAETARPLAEPATEHVPQSEAQSERDAALVKMLSGATLEGSYTNTSADHDQTKLSREQYTIRDVRKLGGNFWLIPARIEYGEHDATLPITVPVEWAGDTPVIVVDDLPLPGFGAVSARVMFFADHYAGYWKHGANGGHLFGTIRRAGDQAPTQDAPSEEPRR